MTNKKSRINLVSIILFLFSLNGVFNFYGCKKSTTNPDPIACFNVAKDKVSIGEKLVLSNCSEDIVKYEWNFGNGEKSDLITPNFSYNKEGTYNVQLIGTDKNGKIYSFNKTVNVYAVLKVKYLIMKQVDSLTLSRVKVDTNSIIYVGVGAPFKSAKEQSYMEIKDVKRISQYLNLSVSKQLAPVISEINKSFSVFMILNTNILNPVFYYTMKFDSSSDFANQVALSKDLILENNEMKIVKDGFVFIVGYEF